VPLPLGVPLPVGVALRVGTHIKGMGKKWAPGRRAGC
jgi:hypothetical protein